MAYTIQLSEEEEKEIKRLKHSEKESKILRRYQCIWMIHKKYPKKEISDIIGVNIDTITDWVKLFQQNGISGLSNLNYEGRRPSVMDDVKDEMKKHIEQESVNTLNELQFFLQEKYSIKVEHSWLSRYCKKNFIALIKRQD